MAQSNEQHTLVVVQKKTGKSKNDATRDYMSSLMDKGIRPLDYLLSTKPPNLEDTELTEATSKN